MAVAFGTRQRTLPMLGEALDVGVEPAEYDFVMLLNGDYNTRPFAVADLLLKGNAKQVLITSVKDSHRNTDNRIHHIARSVLVKCGVPDSSIVFVDSQCGTTFDEANTLSEFMQQQPESTTFCVVTNTYHTRRSRWIFERVLGDEISRVQFISAPTTAYNASNWWKHEDGFTYYLSELLKSCFYLIRYGSVTGWVTLLAAFSGLGWWIQKRRSIRSREQQVSVPAAIH
ncbi:MAG: YdcF family protein [Rubripirellula sp.]